MEDALRMLFHKVKQAFPQELGPADPPQPMTASSSSDQQRARVISADDKSMTSCLLASTGEELIVDLVPGPAGWAVAPWKHLKLAVPVPNQVLAEALRTLPPLTPAPKDSARESVARQRPSKKHNEPEVKESHAHSDDSSYATKEQPKRSVHLKAKVSNLWASPIHTSRCIMTQEQRPKSKKRLQAVLEVCGPYPLTRNCYENNSLILRNFAPTKSPGKTEHF